MISGSNMEPEIISLNLSSSHIESIGPPLDLCSSTIVTHRRHSCGLNTLILEFQRRQAVDAGRICSWQPLRLRGWELPITQARSGLCDRKRKRGRGCQTEAATWTSVCVCFSELEGASPPHPAQGQKRRCPVHQNNGSHEEDAWVSADQSSIQQRRSVPPSHPLAVHAARCASSSSYPSSRSLSSVCVSEEIRGASRLRWWITKPPPVPIATLCSPS